MQAKRTITVRDAAATDVDTITEMNLAMAKETEDKGLDAAALRRGVGRALDEPARAFYLVAELAGEPAGVLMVTREWSDWRDGWFWWIQSVYVAQAARRRGVYRALHEAVRTRARSTDDVIGVRLYVERDNAVAQSTYRAMGMHETHYRLFEEALASDG